MSEAPAPLRGPAPLAFTVYGTPIPKGSTKAFVPKGWKRAIVTSDNPRTKPWQEAVMHAAIEAIASSPPLEGAVFLSLRFYLPRPKSAPRRVTMATKKPDLDKLVRAVKDGLTRAGVYRDDSQVVGLGARKDFAGWSWDPMGLNGIPRAEVEIVVQGS